MKRQLHLRTAELDTIMCAGLNREFESEDRFSSFATFWSIRIIIATWVAFVFGKTWLS